MFHQTILEPQVLPYAIGLLSLHRAELWMLEDSHIKAAIVIPHQMSVGLLLCVGYFFKILLQNSQIAISRATGGLDEIANRDFCGLNYQKQTTLFRRDHVVPGV